MAVGAKISSSTQTINLLKLITVTDFYWVTETTKTGITKLVTWEGNHYNQRHIKKQTRFHALWSYAVKNKTEDTLVLEQCLEQ